MANRCCLNSIQLYLSFLSVLAPASYPQTRIWLDEHTRLNSDKPLVAIYNMPFLYRLAPHHILSIQQLRHTLHLLLIKHLSLRTALVFDSHNNQLIQRIMHVNGDHHNRHFSFLQTTFQTEEQLTHIMHNEKRNPHLFDLAEGLVFRCHIVQYKQISSTDFISDKDVIIFNFHHALFDYPSLDIFLTDLNQAYTTGQLASDHEKSVRYLDCNYQQFSFHNSSSLCSPCL